MAAAAPCENPVCSSKKDAFRAMLRGPPGGGAAAEPTPAAPPCPADREELGRHTWTLMHTMAAYFPEKPTDVQREAATSFIRALGALYPCSHCAEDFRVALDASPPRTSSRSELCVWMCEAHNRVNRDLGKEEFRCDMKKLDVRWRDGGERCGDGVG